MGRIGSIGKIFIALFSYSSYFWGQCYSGKALLLVWQSFYMMCVFHLCDLAFVSYFGIFLHLQFTQLKRIRTYHCFARREFLLVIKTSKYFPRPHSYTLIITLQFHSLINVVRMCYTGINSGLWKGNQKKTKRNIMG